MTETFLVHCHIPKTGGSALNHQLLSPSFGRNGFHRLYRYVFECAAVLPRRHRARSMRSQGASGHIPYGYYRPVYPDAFYFSIFREPVARFVSFLNYVCANPGHAVRRRLDADLIASAASHPDRFACAILQEPRLSVVHSNVQSRLAAGLPRLGERAVDEDDLDHAFRNLLQPDYIWGTQEAFDTFQSQVENWLYARRLRVRILTDIPDAKAKRLAHRFAAGDLAPATLARIRDANQLDMALYEQVLRGLPPRFEVAA